MGRLSDAPISRVALHRYKLAAQTFFIWLDQQQIVLPNTTDEFDLALARFADACWEGESRSLLGDTLTAMQHFSPNLRAFKLSMEAPCRVGPT